MEQKQRQSVGKGYKEEFNLLKPGGLSLRSEGSPPREASEATRKLEALWSSGDGRRGGEDLDEFLSGLGNSYVEEGRVKWDPPSDLDPVFVNYFSRSVEELNNRLQASTIRIDEDGNIRPVTEVSMTLIVDKWITVGEWQNDVDTNILLRNGDWIDIAAQGTIWAGVWFTGQNTARGWEGWTAGNDKPLPGSPPFCLLGRTTEDGYFYIGDSLRRTYQNATLGPGETRFFLRINDNLPGNGSGAFNIHIMVWRNPDALIALTPAGSNEEQTLFRGSADQPASRRVDQPASRRWQR